MSTNDPHYEKRRELRQKNKKTGLAGLWQEIVSAAALSVRIFMRQKIGERSFSLMLVFGAYIWVRCFDFDWRFTTPPNDPENPIHGLLVWLGYLEQFLAQIGEVSVNAFTFSTDPNSPSPLVFIYSIIILIGGLGQWVVSIRRYMKGEKWYSYSRGESVFFSAMIKNSVSYTTIWMIIEPFFLFIIGVLIVALLRDALGLCIMLSAIALFAEEYRYYRETKHEVLDVNDAEYLAQRLEQSLKRFGEGQSSTQNDAIKKHGALLSKSGDQELMNDFITQVQQKEPETNTAQIG